MLLYPFRFCTLIFRCKSYLVRSVDVEELGARILKHAADLFCSFKYRSVGNAYAVFMYSFTVRADCRI